MTVEQSLSVTGDVEPPEGGTHQGTGSGESVSREVGPAEVEFCQLGAASQNAGIITRITGVNLYWSAYLVSPEVVIPVTIPKWRTLRFVFSADTPQ